MSTTERAPEYISIRSAEFRAVIGATLFIIAQNYLQYLMGLVASATAGLPILPQLFHPDRWLLFLGVLFILSIYFFPSGIIGKLRGHRAASVDAS